MANASSRMKIQAAKSMSLMGRTILTEVPRSAPVGSPPTENLSACPSDDSTLLTS